MSSDLLSLSLGLNAPPHKSPRPQSCPLRPLAQTWTWRPLPDPSHGPPLPFCAICHAEADGRRGEPSKTEGQLLPPHIPLTRPGTAVQVIIGHVVHVEKKSILVDTGFKTHQRFMKKAHTSDGPVPSAFRLDLPASPAST